MANTNFAALIEGMEAAALAQYRTVDFKDSVDFKDKIIIKKNN